MSRWQFVRLFVGVTSLALGSSCEPNNDLAGTVVAALGGVLREDLAGSECDNPGVATFPRKVVIVTAETCYQCWNIGRLLRQFELEERRGGQGAIVLTGVADTPAVCSFLRREKVRLPVASSPGVERLRQILADKAILIVQIDANAARFGLVRDSVEELGEVHLDPRVSNRR